MKEKWWSCRSLWRVVGRFNGLKESRDKNKLPPINNVYENKEDVKLDNVIGGNPLFVLFIIDQENLILK